MNRFRLVAFTLCLLLPSQVVIAQKQFTDDETTKSINAVLSAQRDAWNRGDIGGFMDGYEKSDSIVFISGDSLTLGWQTVHDRYKRNYNTPEKMGTLTYSEIEVKPINNDTAIVIGRWHLKRANDEPHGRFTLLFKRTGAGWKIVHDHTSSAQG